jgi:intracellular sulfur oxidation DsrE/DsrF family protein
MCARWKLIVLCLVMLTPVWAASAGAKFVQTPYGEQQVVFDFYFDEPAKINAALYWLRSYINPLTEDPYNQAPEMMDIVVVVHGTEIVTLAKKNYAKYKNAVERMRYYSLLGVKFKVCGLAAKDFNYELKDFYDFVEMVPSAMTELVHWQLQGYALIKPEVFSKKYSIEEIR